MGQQEYLDQEETPDHPGNQALLVLLDLKAQGVTLAFLVQQDLQACQV